jgi:hypothetical protein
MANSFKQQPVMSNGKGRKTAELRSSAVRFLLGSFNVPIRKAALVLLAKIIAETVVFVVIGETHFSVASRFPFEVSCATVQRCGGHLAFFC